MQKKSFAAISTALAAALMISTGSPAYAADAADGSKMTVQQMRQPIPLSLNKVSKVLGQPDVYVYDCNPEDIYEKIHSCQQGRLDESAAERQKEFLCDSLLHQPYVHRLI